ncbi:Restriction endonuclease [Pseudobutyrivibrio sp. ACV-2]|uniref:restriction endonuclease n=1 Tax=Pseudobutyrivibrio sp. ACV-2 TaxID=1520801 RepID=UPI00089790F4|nr:restriction endonuclease [Pseudobutyrivibrio sp. ACV-2]SEA63202.1 Restriction endonuclease [Pseudobutyrivibrio sp. ACV-2]
MEIMDIQQQKSEWKRKRWSIPELRGSKQEWYEIVRELVERIANNAVDMNTTPDLKVTSSVYPWRNYAPFLKGIGVAANKAGLLTITDAGVKFIESPNKRYIADLLHDKYRIFGEILYLLQSEPKTIEDIDELLCREYSLDWANLSNTRRRTDWLEVLGMIEAVGNRKWGLTDEGKKAIQDWPLVSSDVVDHTEENNQDIQITPAPTEIEELLKKLVDNPALHKKRNTYNIWIPSPNRIENLRTIVQYASEKVTRSDLFEFIENEFQLKTSSVESMMPFLKADGLIEEVGKSIYVSTSAAKAWCETGNDLDLLRIMHANKRFVGEMILAAKDDTTRNEVYAEGSKYGMNTEKSRWVMGLLIEAGILEETQYLHVKATGLGKAFAASLPMMSADNVLPENPTTEIENNVDNTPSKNDEKIQLFDALSNSARDPMAEGKASGVAFEENIAAMFRLMGFDAIRIGGAGNTDVVVKWKDNTGKTVTAVVDGKSKSGGTVTHTDISDVAIETHKEKNGADYVAIVGPGFGGDTIKNFARKKGFSLVTDKELIDIALSAKELGLSLDEIALLFKVPNGIPALEELINAQKRQLEIISLVVKTFKQEQEAMDSLSARDLYFLLRGTEISPSLEELINAFELLATDEIGVLNLIKKASPTENTTYAMQNEVQRVNKLRAIASAIECGIE